MSILFMMNLKSTNLNLLNYLLTLRGIGKFQANKICFSLGISQKTLIKEINTYKLDELNRLLANLRKIDNPLSKVNKFEMNYPPIGLNLTRYEEKNILRAININSYKGRRLKTGFPARGQRTRSNANTCKPFKV